MVVVAAVVITVLAIRLRSSGSGSGRPQLPAAVAAADAAAQRFAAAVNAGNTALVASLECPNYRSSGSGPAYGMTHGTQVYHLQVVRTGTAMRAGVLVPTEFTIRSEQPVQTWGMYLGMVRQGGAWQVCGVSPDDQGPDQKAPPMLKHGDVEQYLEQDQHVSAVVCNGGHDMPATQGATYRCGAAGGARFTIKVTDTLGSFTVTSTS